MKATHSTPKQTYRLLLLALALLVAAPLLQPSGLKAQTEAIESILDAGSTGGTRGYRLRRIGANSAAISKNSSFVYYPASALKIWEHFYAMSLVQLGIWDLNTTNVSICTSSNNCNDSPNASNGCGAGNQALNTTLTQMMVPSSNAATNAIQEAVGTLFNPVAPNPAAVGRSVMNNWGSNVLGMTNSGINSKFGCVGACGATPNALTLRDNERLYQKLAGNSILDDVRRVQLKDLMLNESSNYFDQIIDEEAASLNRDNIKADFKSKTYFIYKAGGWSCSGDRYVTIGGLIQLPTYGGAFKRLFTFGAYLDQTDQASYVGGTVGDATREMMRSAIRGALLTWPNDYIGGTNIQGLQSALGPKVGQYQNTRAGSSLRAAYAALGNAANAIPTCDSCPPDYDNGMQEMETALNLIIQANRSLSDLGLDSLVLWLTDVSIDLGRDLQAYVLSTADGSYLSGLLQSIESDLADAKSYANRGSYSKALASLVSAANTGDPFINWNLVEPSVNDNTIGFPVTAASSKGAAAEARAEELEVAVWPNPSNNEVNIHVDSDLPSQVEVQIYDLQGRDANAFFGGIGAFDFEDNLRINTRNTPEGIYLLKVRAGGKTEIKKLIIQH